MNGLRRQVRRGVEAGLAGTTVMTAAYGVERRLRRNVTGPLDYDDSTVPALAAARVLDWSDPDRTAQRVLGLVVHWGYGSAVGAAAVPLADRLSKRAATVAWWAAVTVMAGALFPLLGRTPPPWRWQKDVLATSLAQHLIYAAVVIDRLQDDHSAR